MFITFDEINSWATPRCLMIYTPEVCRIFSNDGYHINSLLLFYVLHSIYVPPLQAIMKSFMVTGSDPARPDKFLAYMVPSPDEVDLLFYSWLLQDWGC